MRIGFGMSTDRSRQRSVARRRCDWVNASKSKRFRWHGTSVPPAVEVRGAGGWPPPATPGFDQRENRTALEIGAVTSALRPCRGEGRRRKGLSGSLLLRVARRSVAPPVATALRPVGAGATQIDCWLTSSWAAGGTG
jgi:hypothetical protein